MKVALIEQFRALGVLRLEAGKESGRAQEGPSRPLSIALENDPTDQAFDSGHLDKDEEPGILAW
jgi:hypothetical protein